MKSGKNRYKKMPTVIIGILLLVCLAFQSQGEEFDNEHSENNWTTTSADARELFVSGLLYADAGDHLTAYSLFSEAIEIDPYFAMAYAYRAFSAGTKEEFVKDTKTALSQVHKVNAFEEVFIYINETYITGDEDQRLNLAMRLTGLAPDNARAWMKLGLILQENNEIEEARNTFEKARLLSPDWVGIYSVLGESYLNYKPVNLKKGLEYYTRAAELNPEIAKVHITLGDIYNAINETELAPREYTKAISENPQSWIAYLHNGYAKSCLGLYEESRIDYQVVRDRSQANEISYVSEALTYAYEGYPETCLTWLEEKTSGIDELDISDTRKRAMKQGCATATGWIALHYNKPDHFSQAKIIHNELNSALTNTISNPNFSMEVKVENLFWDGLEAAIKGYYDAAIVKACDIKILIRESTDEHLLHKYHFLYGYVMYGQGRYGKAIEHLEQGDPNWVYNKYQLAKAYEANGESDVANVLFREVAAYNINDIEFAIIRNEVRNYLALK